MTDTGTAVGSAPAAAASGGSSAPTTFADAFASDATPSSPTPDASTTPPAAAQPGSDQGSPQQDDRSPFIPRQRFDEVNTRLNELKAWKEQHGWVEAASKTGDLQRAIEVAQKIGRGSVEERVAGLQQLIGDLRASDPAMDAAFRSFAGRALATLRQQQGQGQPAPPQAPQVVQVQLEDGSVVALPRDPSAWLQHHKQQWLDELRQELQPVTQTVQTLQQREAAAVRHTQAVGHANSIMSEIGKLPGVTEQTWSRMAEEISRDPALRPNQANSREAVELAAMRAYSKVVLPTYTQQAQSQLLDSLKTKAAASTSVNPGSTAASTPRSYSSFKDLPPEAWR